MQEQSPNKSSGALTQPPIAYWTAEELALLDRLAPSKCRKVQLLVLFPGRSLSAVRVRLARARTKLGLVSANSGHLLKRDLATTTLEPDDPGLSCDWPKRWRNGAVHSNSAFLAALRMAA